MKKIILSYTTLYSVQKWKCYWINKQLGIEQPENEYMKKGKEAHQKISLMIKNKEKLPFDLDFDTSEVHFKKSHNDLYLWHGWADGVNYRSKALLEVKTVSKKLWSNVDMDKSFQPVYYSWISSFKKVFLLTCKFDLSEPKVYYREYTQSDWDRAEKWALNGLKIIEETDYKNYVCDGSCPMGQDCHLFR